MSAEAQACVSRIRLPPGTSSAKFVLWVLANHANGDPEIHEVIEAWPSVQHLVDSTGQDRKTVIANLRRLQEWRLIEDTGKRKGQTGQVVVYRLHIGSDLFTEQCQFRNHPDIGTVPKLGRFKGAKQSQFSAETVPIFRGKGPDIGTRNRKGTIREESISGAHTRSVNEPSGDSGELVQPPDRVGAFEGHAAPQPGPGTPTAAGAIAAALRERGFRITSQSPDLLAAVAEGVTREAVIEFAELYPSDHQKCRGSPGYVLSAARRQHAEQGTTTATVSRGTRGASNGNRRESDAERIARLGRELDEREAAAADG